MVELSLQEKMWAVYTALFIVLNVYLGFRIRKNILLIPFLVFGLMVTIGTICLLSANASKYPLFKTARELAASQQQVFNETHYWQSQSLALTILPASSLLILVGIMEAQLIYIRHMAVAIHNRDHWGSIYLRDPEKSQGFISAQKKKTSLRPWTYWTSLVLMILYFLGCISTIVVQTTDHNNKELGVAICVSILCFLGCFNAGVIWCSCNSTTNHIRTIRNNRDDLMFLRFTPILFSVFMMGVTSISWVYYLGNFSMTGWILLESFSIYLPFMFILIMCIYTGKIQTMGRQYPIEVAQRKPQRKMYPQKRDYSYQTVKDMETVTKKLSYYEVDRKITTPPPATYHPH
ncbi:hypothetical protein HPULCUR_003089 [Helicostylum pulchrum]|uniref:Uncharacterized protein n=1 Tax=Helicostylum pulchrum TaxID=562976 RepID=A0ABP9XSF2_9FUNG